MKAIIYAGKHYGREHEVLSRDARNVTVKHAAGEPFTVNQCDAEFMPIPDELNLNKVDDLAMIARRLVRELRKCDPTNKTAADALDYLERSGLTGNPLRERHESNAELTGRDTRAEHFAEMDERDQRPAGT